MLAQAVTGTPGHINTMAAAVGLMLAHVPLHTMQPGDVYTTNDPWMASGHLNDVLLVAPVFDGATRRILSACEGMDHPLVSDPRCGVTEGT